MRVWGDPSRSTENGEDPGGAKLCVVTSDPHPLGGASLHPHLCPSPLFRCTELPPGGNCML